MTDTANLSLPLLAPSQAQKHVTVNEALVRVDAAVQLSVVSQALNTPPASISDGARYLVGFGAVNEWAGKDGQIAVAHNGGWLFLEPVAGWRVFDAETAAELIYDGSAWQNGAVALSPGGAGLQLAVREFDHSVAAGASSTTAPELPPNAVVFGVTGRVAADIGGSAGSWRLGVAGSDDRYGSGIGLLSGSWMRGLTGTPLTYYTPTELVLTAEGGSFDGTGSVRLAIHYLTLGLPRPL